MGTATGMLDRDDVVRALRLATGALVVLHLLAGFVRHGLGYDNALGFVPLFDFNLESNVPSWFSSSLLLAVALAAFAIARATRMRGGRFVGHWIGIGAVAAFLSLDEAVMLHERVSIGLSGALGGGQGWIGPLVLAVPTLLVGLAYARFLLAIPRETARGLCIAAAIYVSGALVVDAVSAAVMPDGAGVWGRVVAHAVEEALEMLGVIAAIGVLLAHLAWVSPATPRRAA